MYIPYFNSRLIGIPKLATHSRNDEWGKINSCYLGKLRNLIYPLTVATINDEQSGSLERGYQ
jgi:hypothetical protein